MHIIRLRGPWQVEAVERYILRTDGGYDRSTEGLPAVARATMPADWSQVLGGDFLGRVLYCRTFQKPTGLASGERVFLVVEAVRSRGVVALSRPSAVSSGPNGKRLGEICGGEAAGRFEITGLLEDHNRLEIVVEHPALDAGGANNDDGGTNLPGGLIGEVRLEIED